jgi:hypothetical protein
LEAKHCCQQIYTGNAEGDTVGAVFRVAAIIRVAALFGALKIIFSDLFFLHDNLQVVKIQNQKKNFEIFFFLWPFFELKVKTAVFLKLAAAAAVNDLEQ